MRLAINRTAACLLIFWVAACGTDRPLAEFEPTSVHEAAVKQVLMEFQDGVNRHDTQKVARLLHDRATLMVGRDRALFAKTDYLQRLPQRLAALPPIALGQPSISLADTSAKIRIYLIRDESRTLVTFHLTRDDQRWLILGWTY